METRVFFSLLVRNIHIPEDPERTIFGVCSVHAANWSSQMLAMMLERVGSKVPIWTRQPSYGCANEFGGVLCADGCWVENERCMVLIESRNDEEAASVWRLCHDNVRPLFFALDIPVGVDGWGVPSPVDSDMEEAVLILGLDPRAWEW